MSSESFLKEMQTIGEKFLLKLQRLPKADPVEIVSFCVVLLFIGEFIGAGKGVSAGSSLLQGQLAAQSLLGGGGDGWAVAGSCFPGCALRPTLISADFLIACIFTHTQGTIGNSAAFPKALVLKH